MTAHPPPPRGYLNLDRDIFDRVIPDGTDIEPPPNAAGYMTAITADGWRYCTFVGAPMAVV